MSLRSSVVAPATFRAISVLCHVMLAQSRPSRVTNYVRAVTARH